MDGEITIQPPLTLRGFCAAGYEKHSGNWPPHESAIADDFVSFFQLDTFVTLERLQQLCATLGVKICVQELPKGMRGFNQVYENNREIVIGNTRPAAETLGSREHTLLHEIREQIEYEFRHTGHPVANTDKENRAEEFAITVRMYASGKGWMAIFEGVFSNVKSGWAQFGLIVLLMVVFFGSSLACIALPHWEDQL